MYRLKSPPHSFKGTYKCDGVTLLAPLALVSSATALIILSINNSRAFATTQVSIRFKLHKRGKEGVHTNSNRSNLSNFPYILISLHYLFYPRNWKSRLP